MPSGLSELADSDPKIDAAYDAGANGHGFDDFLGDHGLRSTTPSTQADTGKSGGRGHQVVATAGSVIMGLIATGVALSIVDYGPSGPLMWFKAKFLNDVSTPTAGSGQQQGVPLPVAPNDPNFTYGPDRYLYGPQNKYTDYQATA